VVQPGLFQVVVKIWIPIHFQARSKNAAGMAAHEYELDREFMLKPIEAQICFDHLGNSAASPKTKILGIRQDRQGFRPVWDVVPNSAVHPCKPCLFRSLFKYIVKMLFQRGVLATGTQVQVPQILCIGYVLDMQGLENGSQVFVDREDIQ